MSWAAAVEAESEHPIAVAIRGAGPPAAGRRDVEVGPRVSGWSAWSAGTRCAWDGSAPRDLPECLRARGRALRPGRDGGARERATATVVGVIAVATPVRPDAGAAVGRLQPWGCASTILSGDAAPAVGTVARPLGIDTVAERADPVREARRARGHAGRRHRVVMVGDGVNDAPALAAADVGCAVGSGSEAALANSDVALLGSDLEGVPAAVGIARSTSAVIVQNFGWAMGYNLSALPLAAVGLLDPLVAAVAMGLSSLIVVLNSLRLAAARPQWRSCRGVRGSSADAEL